MDCEEKELVTLEREIYIEYREKLVPFIVTLEVIDNEFPVEILNEIRAIFAHLAAYHLDDSEDDLILATRHMKRAMLDCHKYMCVAFEEKFINFRHEYRDIDLGLADNGNFLPEFNRLHSIAKNKIISAKNFESIQKNSSSSDVDAFDLYQKYEEAWTTYDEVNSFLDLSEEAILFASKHTKKRDRASNFSIFLGILGVLIGVVGFFF